jgi:glutamine cyclotransferase
MFSIAFLGAMGAQKLVVWGYSHDIAGDFALIDGVNYRVAVTYNTSTGALKVYINGVLDINTVTTDYGTGTGWFYFGEIPEVDPAGLYPGRLWDVRIYNRVLSEAEVIADSGWSMIKGSTSCGTYLNFMCIGGGYLWAANYYSYDVSKIDLDTGELLGTISSISQAAGINYASDGTNDLIWVTEDDINHLKWCSPSTLTTIGSLTLPTRVVGVANDGTNIYLGSYMGGDVQVVSMASKTLIDTIHTGMSDTQVVYYLDGYIWVLSPYGNAIKKIDPSTRTVVGTVTGLTGPGQMVSVGSYYYVVNWGGTTISKVNKSTLAVDDTITGFPTGCWGIAYDGQYLWLSGEYNYQYWIIDPVTKATIKNFDGFFAVSQILYYNNTVYAGTIGSETLIRFRTDNGFVRSPTPATSGLVFHAACDETTGTVCTDSVAANNGTIHGTTTSFFETSPAWDYTPTWIATYPKTDDLTASSIELLVKTDTDSTAYFVCLPAGADAPTSAQVKAGTDADDNVLSSTLKGTVSLTASVEGSFSATGLEEETDYDLYAVAENDIGLQASPTLVEETTPAAIVFSTTATATVLTTLGDTTATVVWSEGSWSDYRGWPTCAAFFQDRLCFAATKDEPQTVWMTKTGNYIDFGRSVPLVDSDGISVNLPSRQINSIRHLIPLNELLAITSSGEWSISSIINGPLTPTTVGTVNHGLVGASNVTPVTIGKRIIYMRYGNTIVQDTGYQWQNDSFVGDNISWTANHLFEGHSIVDMAYQREPYSLVWFIREDGIALSLTYKRSQYEAEYMNAWGWHDTQHWDATLTTPAFVQANFESVCSIPGTEGTDVYFVVKRGSTRFIETMPARSSSTDYKQQYYLDCSYTKHIESTRPITNIVATTDTNIIVTCPDHGLVARDQIKIWGVVGMTGINSDTTTLYKITIGGNVKVYTFIVTEITDEDTFVIGTTPVEPPHIPSEYNGGALEAGTYVSGGEVYLPDPYIGAAVPWLAYEKVYLVKDGIIVGPVDVMSDGELNTDIGYAESHTDLSIGIPYTSDIKSLAPILPVPDGTLQGQKYTCKKQTAWLYNSLGGKIGPGPADTSLSNFVYFDGLPLLIIYDIALQGFPAGSLTHTALFTGDITVPTGTGYDEFTQIMIRQVYPLPITLRAIIGMFTVGGD